MEWLTEIYTDSFGKSRAVLIEPSKGSLCSGCSRSSDDCGDCSLYKAIQKLNALEVAIGGNYDINRLKELVEADRDGRCVVLPCKPGQTFYTIDRVRTLCHLGYYFDDYDCQGCGEEMCDGGLSLEVIKRAGYSRSQVLSFIDDKKKIFLSEQEAESALKAMKESEEK